MKIARTLVSLASTAAIIAASLLAVSPAQAAELGSAETVTAASGAGLPEVNGTPISAGLSTDDLTTIKESLDNSNEVLSVETEGNTRTTTYEVEGYQVAIEEEKVESTSPGLYWDVNTRYLPRYIFVYLYKADQRYLVDGGGFVLGAVLCAIPGIGWTACTAIQAGIYAAGDYLKSRGLCRGTFAVTIDFNSNPKPWIRYGCQ